MLGEDKKLEGKYLELTKRILGALFFEHNKFMDLKEGTDLVIPALRFACRTRRNKWYDHDPEYRNQFTIRRERLSGAKTEHAKIMEGKAQYMFYAWENAERNSFVHYMILDLKVFVDGIKSGIQPVETRHNDVIWEVYSINQFPPELIENRIYPARKYENGVWKL